MGLTVRRVGGVGLAALAFLPLHRLLSADRAGLAGVATRSLAEELWQSALWGTVIVVVASAALARFLPDDPASVVGGAARRIASVPRPAMAVLLGCVGAAITTASTLRLQGGLPTSVDAMVSLAHARGLVSGALGLDIAPAPAAWLIQNAVVRDGMLVSVYPPGHVVVQALALALGTPWLVGPIAVGLLGAFSFLAFDRMLPDHPLASRCAGLLTVASPFVWLLGASQLSHATAAAAAAFLAWSALEARDGAPGWSVLAGSATGLLVCTRPWTGLVLGTAIVATAWWPARAPLRPTPMGRRLLGLALGGLPWAAGLFAWNTRLFGSPLRLGYGAAFGPAHGLGLHADPWGNRYGVIEAVAYTGADALHLGAALLETPLPALAAVAAALLVLPRSPGRGVLWAWALAPFAANALYWHHGEHLGPRMLYEAAPAWVALTVLAILDARGGGSPLGPRARRAVGWAVAVAVLGAVGLVPARWQSARMPPGVRAASTIPSMPDGPTLLFAHGSWSARIANRMAAAGMRRDSIETLLRRNDTCDADRYARWRSSGGGGAAPEVSFTPLPGSPRELDPHLLSPGNRILVGSTAPDEACRREAASDRLGTVELEPLLWQAPPLGKARTVVVRDLGPLANERVRSAFPEHRAVVLIDGGEGRPPTALPYEDGMELLWRGAAALTEGGG